MRVLIDSRIPWIGFIPIQWKIEKIKHMFKLRISKGNVVQVLLSATQKHGMYPQNKLDGVVQVSENVDLQKFKTIHINDYVISLRSFQGGIEMSSFEGVCSPAYQVFYSTSEINHKYYKFIFKSIGFIDYINSLTVGIREGKNIQFESLSYSYLPVPPIRTQGLIAEFLDKKCSDIDELIDLEGTMIEKLKEYKQAVITETVTKGLNPNAPMKDSGIQWIKEIPEKWETHNVLKIIWLRARLGWRGLKAEEYVEEGYPFLSAFNINNQKLCWEGLNYITKERYDESPEIKLSVGDILLVKDGGIGKCARVDSLPIGEATVNSSLAVVTPSSKLNYIYLYYFFISNVFQNTILFFKNGMGLPHLTQENMKSIKMPLPPLSEQQSIGEFLDKKCDEIDALIEAKQKKITKLKEYKKSIIYEYVTGKKEI